ncbi:MAG: hypothetical protein ACYCR3_00075 [Acidithiobacillus sp.]
MLNGKPYLLIRMESSFAGNGSGQSDAQVITLFFDDEPGFHGNTPFAFECLYQSINIHIVRAWQSGNPERPNAPHEILPTLWGGSDSPAGHTVAVNLVI